ncbi:hypothetical protein JXB22_09580 [candidate division WOR-3 bacterium]|nr:hypothetical protein [candidate division WOR-3 bacterium]
MRYAWTFISLLLIAVCMINCARESDEDAIQALLESSWYVGDGAVKTADDSTNVPQEPAHAALLGDSIPWVRWARWIERPVAREFDIYVNGDSADVTITAYFRGEPPGFGLFVVNDPYNPVFQRTISDSVLRKVKLYKDNDNTWHIAGMTVADIHTTGTDYPVSIQELRARVESRNYEFVVTNPETYFTKEQLPTFYPSDTVEVTVTCSAQDDSTWAFLHHGTGHCPGIGVHIRQPLYRDNITTFSRTWIIAEDSVINTPAVRHSAIDVLGWQTLFGDSTEPYSSRAWCLPYIVMEPGQEIPQDID